MAKAVVSFIIVFAFAFFLGGWFLMPHLPPVPDHPVTVFEAEYWTTNWAGALLGILLGGLSARSVLKKQRSRTGKRSGLSSSVGSKIVRPVLGRYVAAMMKRPLVVLMLVLVGGCVSAQTFRSGSGTIYPPKKANEVLVFFAPEDVQQPYDVIGEINTAGSTGFMKNEGDLTAKARSEAAKLGADAIIIRNYDKGSGGDRAAAIFLGTNDKSEHVTAIRFNK